MTREDKELLLKDLSARLPYGVKVKHEAQDYPSTLEWIDVYRMSIGRKPDKLGVGSDWGSIEFIQPYLRPMSSMTEEELKENWTFMEKDGRGLPTDLVSVSQFSDGKFTEYLDWLNAHHFDYRGLIERGLALEAPDGMYNKEESEKGSEIPIPKTVDEAVKTLAKIVSKEDRDYLLENGAISVHNSMGRWIRNEWGLWTDSELKNELKKKGFEHPDDMSNYIIEEFIKYWNNKNITWKRQRK